MFNNRDMCLCTSECDETDDEVFSDACSDIDTDSIDTDVITQSKRSKSKIGFSNAKLPSFTGKEKWEVWINRFEAVANLQKWDDRTKLSELLTRLQGAAGDFVFDQLNSKTLKNYSKLSTKLKNRFGVFENKRTYKIQFNRRTQKSNEDTADYAAELKRIYNKAYSNRHAKIRQEDLLQRFLMGLSDNEARIHIELTKDQKTIEKAVQEVITCRETTSETQEGNSGKNKKVRQLKKQNNQSSQKSDQTAEKKQNTNFNKQGITNIEKDVITVTKDELQKMFDKMYEDKKRNDETQTPVTGHNHHGKRQFDRQPFNANTPSYVSDGNYKKNNSDRNTNQENIPKCYYCGQPGIEQSIESNVIAKQVLRSDGVYVEGHIQGSEVNLTVDTGAVRTVLSVHAFNKISHVNRPNLEKSNILACADGKPLKELGKAVFEIKLGSLCFSTELIVANIEDEALLGLDVLMKSQWGPAEIKLIDGIMLLGGHVIQCTQIGQTNKLIRKIYVAMKFMWL
ncbi:unnamed protein product [Mytilus coruscus]|uniref:Paraneoplastic antigen Ma-like C-terminal domain-containing protein n=1 Tax=Mytilus coruscus TaxID=42192 RepID=A0A6J8CV30_MYTCO|nr:unnamed protein product [Mytilus coruscus]